MLVNFKKSLFSSASIFAILCAANASAIAGPQGGEVVGGSATINQENATKTGVNQSSDKVIINWQSYNINANEHVQYYQPSVSSIALNRVVGQDPSKILGQLSANGNVWLINRNGIMFGAGSRIDVNGLVATTHDIKNSDFLAGRYNFNIPGNSGASVINEGNITIGDAGIAAFVAPSVVNRGIITAKLGKVSLGAANGFTLDMYGDGLISIAVSDDVAQTAYDIHGNKLDSFVKNEGKIKADGGHIVLTAKAARSVVNDVVNNSGVIEARSVSQKNGVITLGGGSNGVVRSSGKITASGNNKGEKGGKVIVTGEKVALTNDAIVDVSGYNGGGTALIGGDYQGDGVISPAAFTYVGENVTIDADAKMEGNGGKVIVWADQDTRVYGSIYARGGILGGDGGFIETSGKKFLDIAGITVNAYAYNGLNGEWLLDPTADVYIVSSGYQNAIVSGNDPRIFQPAATPTYIKSSSIEAVLNQGVDVTIMTYTGSDSGKGIIYIEDNIDKISGGITTLTLLANTGVYLDDGHHIASTHNKLNIVIDADADDANGGIVKLYGGSSYALQTNGGDVDIRAWDHVYEGRAIKTDGGDVTLRHIDEDATWLTIARAKGTNFVVDAGTGDVLIDTKYSSPGTSDHYGDRVEFGNYAVRANKLEIEASEITNIGQGFDYGNSEYSYTTPTFDDDDGKGELYYRRTPIVRGGADLKDIDGHLITPSEFSKIDQAERRGNQIEDEDDAQEEIDNQSESKEKEFVSRVYESSTDLRSLIGEEILGYILNTLSSHSMEISGIGSVSNFIKMNPERFARYYALKIKHLPANVKSASLGGAAGSLGVFVYSQLLKASFDALAEMAYDQTKSSGNIKTAVAVRWTIRHIGLAASATTNAVGVVAKGGPGGATVAGKVLVTTAIAGEIGYIISDITESAKIGMEIAENNRDVALSGAIMNSRVADIYRKKALQLKAQGKDDSEFVKLANQYEAEIVTSLTDPRPIVGIGGIELKRKPFSSLEANQVKTLMNSARLAQIYIDRGDIEGAGKALNYAHEFRKGVSSKVKAAWNAIHDSYNFSQQMNNLSHASVFN